MESYMPMQWWPAVRELHAHAKAACCGRANTGRSKFPPFCTQSSSGKSSLLSSLRISSEKRNYSCVTLSRFSIWYRTMGYELTSDLPPVPRHPFFCLRSRGYSRSLGSHHPRCPVCAQAHTATMSDVREREEPESNHLKEKWERGRTQVPLGTRDLEHCHRSPRLLATPTLPWASRNPLTNQGE